MGLHIGIDKYIDKAKHAVQEPADSGWKFRFPNTADFNFNYYKLLSNAESSSIGRNQQTHQRIAIIGAGLAGLTAARELFRCGYTAIDLYEASDRIGGRTYSIPVQDEYNQHTVFEMGAMRIPFFSAPGSKNSVVDYYSKLFQISTQLFPDPGSPVADTGIFLNNGYGPDTDHPYARPTLNIWKTAGKPPHRLFNQVYKKWSHFATLVKQECQKHYVSENWQTFWHHMVQHYWDKNFRELVYMPAIAHYHPAKPGYFGGLGMTEAEANLFYTIGAGDGSWGAFYDISCLYPIRTLLFGFGANHQLMQGRFDAKGNFVPGQQYGKRTEDSLGNTLEPPHYLGVQALAECLFYQPVASKWVESVSLYQASKLAQYDINLYTQNPVTKLKRSNDETIEITSAQLAEPKIYDRVILTVPAWALQLSTEFEGFDPKTQFPFDVINSLKVSHWISSCKVFYPLKERYWGEGKRIPQLISTDTFLQGVYGYAVKDDAGVLLVSYTWEDDANKLIAPEQENASAEAINQVLAQKCLNQLDRILLNCHNIKTPISPYVDTSKPAVIHWSRKPNYRGCAKLYRETTWNTDYALLRYNQTFSANSHLYFAGEAFSVEGGWIEPALRSALDAVIHLIKNTQGTFLNQFRYSDYPKYDNWSPTIGSESEVCQKLGIKHPDQFK